MFVSVVIPTRHEQANAAPLLARLVPALRGWDAEVIVVDDSDDEATVEAFAAAAAHGPSTLAVRTLHRVGAQRQGSLSGAVLDGVGAGTGHWVVVMDGDLQHPPELVPALVHHAAAGSADVAIASRYCAGTSREHAAGLESGYRRAVSRATGTASRVLFPRRLGRITDPMSGFFAIRRASLPDLTAMQPRGFKILLALLLATPRPLSVVEVPFAFGSRTAGETKADWRMGAAFGTQLVRARLGFE